MVFLIAYALFEVPSNYFLKKLRPSVCLASPHADIIKTYIFPSDGLHSSCSPGAQQPWASAAPTTTPK